jgi:AcrR family transcriptional regulator
MTKVADGDRVPATRAGRMPRAARRAQLLRVADALFAERGYEATSMDDVAASAQISKPVLYDHFGSKEGLFAACVEQVGDELTERIDRVAAGADGPQGTLLATTRAYFAYAREQGNVLAVLLDAGPPPAAVILEQVLRIRRRQTELTVRLLRDSLATERLTIDDHRVEATAHALVGTYEGLTAWWYEHPDVDVDTLTGWFLDLVWPGLHQLLLRAEAVAGSPNEGRT